jgi:hypothetical protein
MKEFNEWKYVHVEAGGRITLSDTVTVTNYSTYSITQLLLGRTYTFCSFTAPDYKSPDTLESPFGESILT